MDCCGNDNKRKIATPKSVRNGRWWFEKIAFLTFFLVGGYYLVTEHRAHLFGFLPYAILLICPIMHLFMHKGHHRSSGDGK